jgi:S-DNA-T family DNA segregation ATPase FtsK/SpoIIIE
VLSRKLLLALIDRNDYATAGLSVASLPARFGPGRAVDAADGLEIQLALLSGEATPGAEQAAVHRINSPTLAAGPAIKIRSLPATVRRAELVTWRPAGPQYQAGSDWPDGTARRGNCLLGLGGDEAQPVWADLFGEYGRFLISGPALSGRSTAALLIARQALEAGLATLVAAPRHSPLATWATRRGLAVLGPDSPVIDGTTSAAQLVLIDDAEQFNDTPSGNALTELVTNHPAAVVATARSDDLAASFRGPAVAVRRRRTGLLLQPSAADGELLGIRTGPCPMPPPPGRGLLVTDALRRTAPDGLALQVAI